MMFDDKPKPKGRYAIFRIVGMLFGVSLILAYSAFLKPKVPHTSSIRPPAGVGSILEAVAAKKSGVIVQGFAAVKTILPDDADGAKHQKFIAALENGHTLLFAHNIDIAPRVPVKPADMIEFRGEYEWNDKGGVVHWTHHDPDMKHEDGFIKLNDKVYR
jgi:hypothetical protein